MLYALPTPQPPEQSIGAGDLPAPSCRLPEPAPEVPSSCCLSTSPHPSQSPSTWFSVLSGISCCCLPSPPPPAPPPRAWLPSNPRVLQETLAHPKVRSPRELAQEREPWRADPPHEALVTHACQQKPRLLFDGKAQTANPRAKVLSCPTPPQDQRPGRTPWGTVRRLIRNKPKSFLLKEVIGSTFY